jgi:enoyl-CoA hydratase/carnithine racemase
MNALSPDLSDVLIAAFVEAGSDPEVRAIVLTAVGDQAFCAGADLKARAQGDAAGKPFQLLLSRVQRYLHEVVSEIIEPTIAALNEAMRIAEAICNNAPVSLRRMKEIAVRSNGLPVPATLRLNEGISPYSSENRLEGIRLYVEKRPPVWRGRCRRRRLVNSMLKNGRIHRSVLSLAQGHLSARASHGNSS